MHPVTRSLLLATIAGGSVALFHATIAKSASSTPSKPPEVTTVGTSPASLSYEDQAKLEAFLREFEARLQAARARLSVPRTPGVSGQMLEIGPAVGAPAKGASLETREPARGPRNRTKPVGNPAPAEKGVRP